MDIRIIKMVIDDKIHFLNLNTITTIDCYKRKKDYIIKISFIDKNVRAYHFSNKEAYDKMINGLSKRLYESEFIE